MPAGCVSLFLELRKLVCRSSCLCLTSGVTGDAHTPNFFTRRSCALPRWPGEAPPHPAPGVLTKWGRHGQQHQPPEIFFFFKKSSFRVHNKQRNFCMRRAWRVPRVISSLGGVFLEAARAVTATGGAEGSPPEIGAARESPSQRATNKPRVVCAAIPFAYAT